MCNCWSKAVRTLSQHRPSPSPCPTSIVLCKWTQEMGAHRKGNVGNRGIHSGSNAIRSQWAPIRRNHFCNAKPSPLCLSYWNLHWLHLRTKFHRSANLLHCQSRYISSCTIHSKHCWLKFRAWIGILNGEMHIEIEVRPVFGDASNEHAIWPHRNARILHGIYAQFSTCLRVVMTPRTSYTRHTATPHPERSRRKWRSNKPCQRKKIIHASSL